MNSTKTDIEHKNKPQDPSPVLLIKDAGDLEGIALSLEGSLSKIREFFKIRDDLQLEIERHGTFRQMKMCQLLDVVSRFFMAFGMEEDEVPASENIFIKSKLDLARLVPSSSGEIHSFKLNMLVTKRKKYCMDINMVKIWQFLREKYPEHNIDAMLLLYFLFRFGLERKYDLESFILSLQGFTNNIEIDEDEPDKKTCQICANMDVVVCDVYGETVCLKCRHFFDLHMKRHSLYSLRCQHPTTVDDKMDVSCRSCKIERCRNLGMIDEYQYQELRPSVRNCLVCGSTEKLKSVCGSVLCLECRMFFDNTCDLLHQKRLRENCPNIYECQTKRNACNLKIRDEIATTDSTLPISSSSKPLMCSACLWSKMEEIGLIDVYTIQTQGQRSYRLSDERDTCAVCLQNCCNQEEWLGVNVCQVCRSFLSSSMNMCSHRSYCCPGGELDHLCQVPDERDRRCKYCWFRRLELQGLVDRWIMCDGKTLLWSKDRYESNSDDDQDSVKCSVEEIAPKKMKLVSQAEQQTSQQSANESVLKTSTKVSNELIRKPSTEIKENNDCVVMSTIDSLPNDLDDDNDEDDFADFEEESDEEPDDHSVNQVDPSVLPINSSAAQVNPSVKPISLSVNPVNLPENFDSTSSDEEDESFHLECSEESCPSDSATN